MTTGAALGIGTVLEFETTPGASPVAFTTLAQTLDIPPLPNTLEFVESTNQDSTGFTREYIPGLIDAESFTATANYLPQDASQNSVYNLFKNRTKCKWRVRETTTSPARTLTFDAFVSAWSPSFPVNGKKLLSVTLRRTGPTVRV